MNTRTVQLSFAGGEISPELYGRPDAVQYRTGAAQMKNWVVKPQGPARTRPGLEWIATSAFEGPSRLLPFIYSTGQSAVVEIGNRGGFSYARFYADKKRVRWGSLYDFGDVTLALDASNRTLTNRTGRHGFVGGEAVRVLISEGGTYPTGLNGTDTFYVTASAEFTVRRFQLSTSLANANSGTAIAISGGSGRLSVVRASNVPAAWSSSTAYDRGDLVSHVLINGELAVYASTQLVNAASQSNPETTSSGANPLWNRLPYDSSIEIKLPNSYADEHLSGLVWRQNGDVLTIANNIGNYPLIEIRRASSRTWRPVKLVLGSSLDAPTGVSVTETRGARVLVEESGTENGNRILLTTGTNAAVALGDVLYFENINLSGYSAFQSPVFRAPNLADKFFVSGHYIVDRVIDSNKIGLRDFEGRRLEPTGQTATVTASADFYYSSSTVDTQQFYVVTALDDDGRESLQSPPTTADNTLETNGAKNTISWAAVDGADRYRVYKKENGLFGYIGESDETTFDDDNIAPDLGRTPPRTDPSITGTNYPAAVGGHEQRLFVASTLADPQTVWGSRTGSELDFTYTLPTQDNNRIKFELDSNQAQTVRHIVGMRDLILLTLSGEFRVRATDDGGLAPSTVFARQEGFDGANFAQPAAVSNHVLYCAARGGHVRKLAYEARRAAFESIDVSLRATHLFDDYDVTGFAAGKAPFPCVWACSSSGKLLGLTFVPEEQVEGWHQHETAGSFESVAVVPEGDEDVLYALIKRTTSSGATVRTIERMREINDTDAANLDSHRANAGVWGLAGHPYDAGVRINDVKSRKAGSLVTLAGRNSDDTANQVAWDPQFVGDEVHLRHEGQTYRVRITSYTTNMLVAGELLDDIPESLVSKTVTENYWRFAARGIVVPAWLQGSACTVVADNVEHTNVVAKAFDQYSAYAVVELAEPALNVYAGLPYTCDLQTLPIAVQVEGLGTGREKNVDKAWLRLYESAGLQVGPDADNLQPVTDAQNGAELVTGEKRTLVTGKWTEDGQLLVRQARPFPATVVSLAARVSFGD